MAALGLLVPAVAGVFVLVATVFCPRWPRRACCSRPLLRPRPDGPGTA